MKRIFSILLIIMLLSGTLLSFAQDTIVESGVSDNKISVYYNDSEVLRTISAQHGPYMIPEEFISEILGGVVTYNKARSEVILEGNSNKLSLHLDGNSSYDIETGLSTNFFRRPVSSYDGVLYFDADFIASVFDLTKTLTEQGKVLHLESLGYLQNKVDGEYDYITLDPNKVDISDFKENDVKDNEKKLGYTKSKAEGLDSVLFYDNGNDIANKWNGKTTLQEDYKIIEGLFRRTQTGGFIDKLNVERPRIIGLDGELYSVSYTGSYNKPEETELIYNLKNSAFKFDSVYGSPAIGVRTFYHSKSLRENTDGYYSYDLAEMREVLRYYFRTDEDFKYFWTSYAQYFYYMDNPDLISKDNIDIEYLKSLYNDGRSDILLPNGTRVHIGMNSNFQSAGDDPISYIWFTRE